MWTDEEDDDDDEDEDDEDEEDDEEDEEDEDEEDEDEEEEDEEEDDPKPPKNPPKDAGKTASKTAPKANTPQKAEPKKEEAKKSNNLVEQLWKKGAGGLKKTEQRWMCIENTKVKYAKKEAELKSAKNVKSIELKGADISSMDKNSGGKYWIRIKGPSNREIACKTKDSRDKWIAALKQVAGNESKAGKAVEPKKPETKKVTDAKPKEEPKKVTEHKTKEDPKKKPADKKADSDDETKKKDGEI